MQNIPPMPVLSPLVPERTTENEKQLFTMNQDWYRWLEEEIRIRLQKLAPVVAYKPVTAQAAAIATTTLLNTTLSGFYRVSNHIRVVTPGTVSGSFTLTLGWTDGGVPQTKAYAAVAGNLTTTWDAQTLPIHADGGTAITYAVAYASVGATQMAFRSDTTVEQLS